MNNKDLCTREGKAAFPLLSSPTGAAALERFLARHDYPAFTPKAVLFDMDGVLFDSMPNHASSWAKVCTDFGLSMTPEEAYMHEGRTGEATIQILAQRYWNRPATAEEIEQIYEAKCRLFNACPEAPKMQGAAEVLQAVKDLGLTIAVVTGSGQQSLLQRLEDNYPGVFQPELIVSSKDVRHGKPNPEPYLLGLERTGLKPWEAIVVENAPLGVQAAVAAGIFTIAVNTGPLPESVLLQSGANLLFPSMTALAKALVEA
ncbi:MAG: HAD family hydrolase [Alloprevotella sp.]